jgi:hypothetical protein
VLEAWRLIDLTIIGVAVNYYHGQDPGTGNRIKYQVKMPRITSLFSKPNDYMRSICTSTFRAGVSNLIVVQSLVIIIIIYIELFGGWAPE